MKTKLSYRDHLLGAGLAMMYVGLLLMTSQDLAMSRDESFYVVAAQDYARWFEQLANDSGAALEQTAIDQAWDFNHEHPGLVKSLFALSWLAHQKWELFSTDSNAFRFPGMVSGGLLLWLLYVFGAQVFSRSAGLFAALSFALVPRVFYHSHLNCFDIPITLALTWVAYCYWRAYTSRGWVLLAGIAYGLALATKHNAWILPGILLIHYMWLAAAARKSGRAVPKPWWLLSMLLIGPILFFATWPWLWHENWDITWERVAWYVQFHLNHEYYNMAYFGENYFYPPFPMSFPFVMTLFTVPLTTIALAIYGIALRHDRVVPSWVSRLWRRRVAPTEISEAEPATPAEPAEAETETESGSTVGDVPRPEAQDSAEHLSTRHSRERGNPVLASRSSQTPGILDPHVRGDDDGFAGEGNSSREAMSETKEPHSEPDAEPTESSSELPSGERVAASVRAVDWRCTDVLLLGLLTAPLLVIALPSTPIFGGTKHWFPAYPYIALYAGLGFTFACERLCRYVRGASLRQATGVGLAALLLAPSALETAHAHPFGLSHYTALAGGVPGAADLGMNRQFWGFTTGSLADWLKQTMPDGGSVWLCDMTWQAWQMMQRDGVLPRNLRAAPNFVSADYVMVHHEHHFAEVDFQAWVAFGSTAPIHVLTYDGVPIISVYQHPRRRSSNSP